jgi:hypothetical protein
LLARLQTVARARAWDGNKPSLQPSPNKQTNPQALNEPAIRAALDVCLLTDTELAAPRPPEAWAKDDPLFGPDDE